MSKNKRLIMSTELTLLYMLPIDFRTERSINFSLINFRQNKKKSCVFEDDMDKLISEKKKKLILCR